MAIPNFGSFGHSLPRFQLAQEWQQKLLCQLFVELGLTEVDLAPAIAGAALRNLVRPFAAAASAVIATKLKETDGGSLTSLTPIEASITDAGAGGAGAAGVAALFHLAGLTNLEAAVEAELFAKARDAGVTKGLLAGVDGELKARFYEVQSMDDVDSSKSEKVRY